jgi:hypothetical protein
MMFASQVLCRDRLQPFGRDYAFAVSLDEGERSFHPGATFSRPMRLGKFSNHVAEHASPLSMFRGVSRITVPKCHGTIQNAEHEPGLDAVPPHRIESAIRKT